MIAVLILALATSTVSGVVHDSTGAVVVGASVVVRSASGPERQTQTGPDGRFAVETPDAGDVTVIVRAGGFAEKTERVSGADRNAALDIEVTPAAILETVTVTPNRREQRLGDTPASVSVLTGDEIKASPAVVADDVLRAVPTFSLFRRTSSLSSHPTSQGVSLRGIGPSGVSRTLVLIDGVPFNDPFGGWVYWTRVPLESTDRIEIVDGSSSSLYGNYAMGGVINIVTSRPARRTVEFKPQFGSRNSPKADFFASDVWGKLGVAVEGSVFNTDGFPIVAAAERGPIDINADLKYRNVNSKVEYAPSDRFNVFFRGGYFTEDRTNGKIGEVNDTRWKFANGGVRLRLPDQSELQGRLFVDAQQFHSTFLAVTNSLTTRNLVRLATDQHVPTHSVGGMAQWTRPIGGGHVFGAGADWRWVDGDSNEDAYVAATPQVVTGDPAVTIRPLLSVQRSSGGSQQSAGAFLQDVFAPVPKLTVTLSARVDHWRNYDAHNLETTVATGLPTANNRPSLPDRDDTVFSPRVAALYHIADRVSVWGDVSTGFRAPTLNELYRQFSVGAIVTRANDQLGPERLVGGEAGLNLAPARNVTVRTTWFDNRVTNPVSNVTIGTNLQQRQNLGETRIWGVQTDVEYRYKAVRVAGGYLYNRAKVTDGGAANAGLVGKFLPQVPTHRGSAQIVYASPKYATVALGMQFIGLQFDDDQNVRAVLAAARAEAGYSASTDPGLPGYAVVDVRASRAFGRNVEIFVGVQNLFDREYFVGTQPDTIATPRLVNGGVRLHFVAR